MRMPTQTPGEESMWRDVAGGVVELYKLGGKRLEHACLYSSICRFTRFFRSCPVFFQRIRVCMYGKLNYFLGRRAADDGRDALYPKIDFCEFPQGVCSSYDTYGGELQWMVGFFEWTDRIQTYDVDGWNYIEKLKEFCDGGYMDFSFVDSVSGVLNIGCHNPPCKGFMDAAADPHNMRDRNDIFQRFLNHLQVARTFRPPPKPTPMPSPAPTEVWINLVLSFHSILANCDSHSLYILCTGTHYWCTNHYCGTNRTYRISNNNNGANRSHGSPSK